MSKRSYQQYCPIAYGLDVIGERWTLLIVRELALGPRRFTDLQRGLPGLSPNLLTTRLRSLEEVGILESVALPPPSQASAYALTRSGAELGAALGPFALWGMRFLPSTVPAEDFVSAVAVMQALRVLYRPELQPEETLTAEVTLAPDVFRVRARSSGLEVIQGFSPEAALALQTTPERLLALAAGPESREPAGDLLRRGSPALLRRFLGQFAFPAG